MKKLLIGLFAAASASIVAHAAPISGTSFEGVALKDFGGSADGAIAVNSDDAGVSGNPSYWAYESATDGQKVGWFTNRTNNAEGQWGDFENPGYIWGENNTVGLPDISGGNFANDEKYLKLDANTRINRLISLNGGTSEDMDGVYFDAMVQFTPTYEAPELDDADKIAVWLYGSDGDDGIKDGNDVLIQGTNIVVTAGFITGANTPETKHYFTTKEIEPNTWHRVTIKAIKKISSEDSAGGPVAGFVVFIDGVAVATEAGVAREDVDGSTPVFNALTSSAQIYNNKNALFPSRVYVNQGVAASSTISLAGFIGTGAIDDVSFTRDAPAFVEDLSTFTIQWGEGLASLTINNVAIDLTQASGKVEYEYQENATYVVEAVPQAGYCNATWSNDAGTVTQVGNTGTFSPTGAGTGIINIVPSVAVIEKNGVTTEYADFASALDASVSGDTIKLARGFEISDTGNTIAGKNLIVDLNGQTIQVTAESEKAFSVVNGSLTLITSQTGGTITKLEDFDEGDPNGVLNVGNDGTIIIGLADASADKGVTINGMLNTVSGSTGAYSLVRGKFHGVNNDMGYINEGNAKYAVATGSEVTGPDEGGFYTVAPAVAALTIQITSADTTYNQTAQRPEYVVKQGDTTISEGYTIAWTKDGTALDSPSFIEAGVYVATVTYEGATATATYTIAPRSIAGASVVFEAAPYTGSTITPMINSISVDGLTVPVANTTVTPAAGETIQNVGSYTVTVSASGNFTGSTTATFAVSQKKVTATVQLAKSEDYYVDGLALPNVTSIGFGGDTLVENTDYTVAWDKNAITEPQDSAEIYTLTVSPVDGSNFTFDSVTATYTVRPEQTTPEPGKYVGPGGGEFTLPAEATAPAGKKWSDTVTVAGVDITYAQAYALNLISETGEVSGTIKTSIAIVDGKVVLDVQGKEGYAFEAKFFKSTNLAAKDGGWTQEATIDSGAEGGEDAGTQAFYKVSIVSIKINDAKAE